MSLSVCPEDCGPAIRSYELSPEEYERELTAIYDASRNADGGEYSMLRTPNVLKRREQQRVLDEDKKHMYDNIEAWRLKPTVEELMERWRQQGQEYLQKRQSAQEAKELRARRFTPPPSPGSYSHQQQHRQQEQQRQYRNNNNNVASPPSSISTSLPLTTNLSPLQSEIPAIPNTPKVAGAVSTPGLSSVPASAYLRNIVTRSRSRFDPCENFQALDARSRPVMVQHRKEKTKELQTAASKIRSGRVQKSLGGRVKRDSTSLSSIPATAAAGHRRKRR